MTKTNGCRSILILGLPIAFALPLLASTAAAQSEPAAGTQPPSASTPSGAAAAAPTAGDNPTDDGPPPVILPPAEAPTPPAPPAPEAAPPAPPPPSSGTPSSASPAAAAAAPPKALVSAKYAADLYGFVEFDAIHDSTQSFNESAGNGVIQKTMTYPGDHHRLMFSGRNSRIGLKLQGPQSDLVRSSAILEMDFLGNQPPAPPLSEASLLTNATFRFRHMALKLETPIVDFLIGQYWQLFGWQSYFHPNTVEIQGVPGEVYSRAPQLRVSHTFKSDAVTLDLAVAIARPPQRDGAVPDTQAGVRLLINGWKGLHTAGSTGTAIDAAGIGVSGDYREFRVDEFLAKPVNTVTKKAGGISVDVMIPIIPASADHHADALTFTGSFARTSGGADFYTGLTGGLAFPSLPDNTMTYTPNVDPGLVTYTPTGELHAIIWQSFLVGLQYYLPPNGNVWISGNFSQLSSPNIDTYATGSMAPKVFDRTRWADGNVFWDVNKAVRFGAEVAWFKQRFADGITIADNYRVQLSAFFIF